MRRKNEIVVLLAWCAALLVVAGCGGRSRGDVAAGEAKDSTKATKVEFYVENSGSMYGYVQGGTQFKDVLEHLLVMSKETYGQPGIQFINAKVVPTGLGDDVENFCLRLNPVTMKQGNTSSSNINSIFSQILEHTDDHTVSVLFSDCIYSVQKGNALEYLNHQKNQTQRAFMDAIGKHGGDLALVMLQCKSVFNGFYFDMLDQPLKYYGFRPYFVVIMGETARVRDFCNRIELDEDHVNGLLHKYMVSSQNTTLDQDNACVLTSDFSNVRRIIPSRGKLGIDRLDLSGREVDSLYFSVAVDANRLFTDESYLKDTANYETSPAGLRVVRVDRVAPEGSAYGDCAAAGLENPYYLTLQTPNEAIGGKIGVNLKYRLPEWIALSSTTNDVKRVPPFYVTFGIDHMMRGINDAFLAKNEGKGIFHLDFVINRTGRSSSFPTGLVVIALILAAIVGISIKMKR
ncbi:MAG: hypothetical protein II484_01130 [Bacteroidaceae bacterium]|nr:hypothetical protein [Bacteroidaceae bacterium]